MDEDYERGLLRQLTADGSYAALSPRDSSSEEAAKFTAAVDHLKTTGCVGVFRASRDGRTGYYHIAQCRATEKGRREATAGDPMRGG
jgi:hypothetical protein